MYHESSFRLGRTPNGSWSRGSISFFLQIKPVKLNLLNERLINGVPIGNISNIIARVSS